ncbi:MAG: hypothetical protein LBP53_03265 [Candidatus Peribacteria bacterium]|nr:hypothetical protein [Candidatus Peribacteria bacterium]
MIGKWNKKQIALKHLTYQKEKYELLFCEYRNASDILVLDFFEGLLTSYLLWKTTQEKKYFIDTIRLTLSDRFFFLSLEELPSVSTVDEDFFTFYKNYYLTGLAFNHWRGFVPIIALFTGEYVDVPQHQAFIKQLTYQDMQYILSLVLA